METCMDAQRTDAERIAYWRDRAEAEDRVAKDNQSRQMLAAFIGRNREWCWERWQKFEHPERDWAISELAKLVREGDDSPDIIRKAVKK